MNATSVREMRCRYAIILLLEQVRFASAKSERLRILIDASELIATFLLLNAGLYPSIRNVDDNR